MSLTEAEEAYVEYCRTNGGALTGVAGFRAGYEIGKALTAAPASPGGWRPIETAPKGVWAERVDDPAWVDPPEIQLLFEGGRQCVGRWDWYYAAGGAGAHETNGCGWLEALTLEPVTLHLSEPTHWMFLPSPPGETAGPRSRDVPQDDQIPTPKPVPILAREGQEGDQGSSGVPAAVAASTGVKSDSLEGH
jgi:hypothetical protein